MRLRFVCYGYCTFKSCESKVKVWSVPNKRHSLCAAFSGKFHHVGIKGITLKGKRRSAFKKRMKKTYPRRASLDCLLLLIPEDVWLSGNRDAAPSQAVLNKVRQEAGKIVVPDKTDLWNSLTSIRGKQVARDQNKKIDGTLRRQGKDPQYLMFWSLETMKIFRGISKIDIIYLDATGSILRNSGQGTFYMYELVVRHPVKGKSPIAVASLLSNRHNIATVSNFLFQFCCDEKDAFRGPIPLRGFSYAMEA